MKLHVRKGVESRADPAQSAEDIAPVLAPWVAQYAAVYSYLLPVPCCCVMEVQKEAQTQGLKVYCNKSHCGINSLDNTVEERTPKL